MGNVLTAVTNGDAKGLKDTNNSTIPASPSIPIDAAVIWEATSYSSNFIHIDDDPILSNARAYTKIVPLSYSIHQYEAMRFARYLTASDKGLLILKNNGYQNRLISGGPWQGF